MRGGAEGARWSQPMVVGLTVAVVVTLVAASVSLMLPPRPGPVSTAAAATIPAKGPFQGLGAWVDMYSWSESFSHGAPDFGPADIDAMAAAGVQTLYIQAAEQLGPATVLEGDRLLAIIHRAHRHAMSVVAWYMPTLANLADDITRLRQISRLPVEGLAVDIESTAIADIGLRNAALIALSQQLRRAVPGLPLGAIVLPATLLEVVNTHYWPDFPYPALAPSYNAWLPMVYWTGRLTDSGFRDGYRYTADSVRRLRADLGRAGAAAVHPIAGVSSDGIGLGDFGGFVRAVKETGSVGGSVYEWPGTDPTAWATLRALRA